MSNLKKIQKPKINANLDIISTLDELLQLIEDDEKIYDKLIENMEFNKSRGKRKGSIFHKWSGQEVLRRKDFRY